MQLNARLTGTRFPRAFQKWTRISVQVRGGSTIFLSKEQGEANNQNDGVQLTQTTTNPPYDCWWKGDLWYSSNVDNTQFQILVIGQADETFRP
jgi:hypothetical protein